MRNFMMLVIIGLVVYTVFQDKRKAFEDFVNTKKPIEQEQVEKDSNQQSTEPVEKNPAPKNYAYQPKNMVERVITNAVTDFVKTPAGSEMAKNMLLPADPDYKKSSITFTTKGYNILKQKYDLKQLTNSEGKRTICGQKVRAHYIVNSANNREVASQIEDFVVGKHAIEELNIITNGLKENEVVTGNYLSMDKAITQTERKGNKITIGIVKHLHKSNFDPMKIKIFDDYVTTARPVVCGDNVNFRYKILELDGEIIKDGELTIEVGNYSYPEVLSYVLDKMPLIGSRTVILPKKYISLNEKPLINTDSNNFIILELSKASIIPNIKISQDNGQ